MRNKRKLITSMMIVAFILLSLVATILIIFAATQQTIKTAINITYRAEDIDGTAEATYTIGGVTKDLTAKKGDAVLGKTLVFKAADKEDAGNLMFPEDALDLTAQNDNVVIQYTYSNTGDRHYIASLSMDDKIDADNMKIEYSINGVDYSTNRYAITVPGHTIGKSYWIRISIVDKAKNASLEGEFVWLLEANEANAVSFIADEQTKTYSAYYDGTNLTDGVLNIPSYVNGYPVVAVSNNLNLTSAQKQQITSISIPQSVEIIGERAFDGFSNLESISFGQNESAGVASAQTKTGLTTIGAKAFKNCSSLTSVVIPDSVTLIGANAFSGCSNLDGVTLKNTENWFVANSATAIKGTSLSSADLANPTTVATYLTSTYVDKYWLNKEMQDDSIDPLSVLTFELNSDGNSYYVTDCDETATGSLTIPSIYKGLPVTSIGDVAFGGCTGLTNITIPDSVTSIRAAAFSGCTGLTSITVESGNTTYHSVGNCIIATENKILIAGCKTSVIPTDGSVASIASHAFENCSGLTSITIPDSVTSIGNSAFSGCTGLTSIVIPDSVTIIWTSAFSGCTGLTSIVIPDSVTSICSYAFSYCTGLTSVTISEGVNYIDFEAFAYCTSLTSVTFENPNGWYFVVGGIKERDLESTDLANESTAATYLTSTYVNKNWKRGE